MVIASDSTVWTTAIPGLAARTRLLHIANGRRYCAWKLQRIEEMQDPDPNNMGALEIRVSSIGR